MVTQQRNFQETVPNFYSQDNELLDLSAIPQITALLYLTLITQWILF